MKQLIKSLVIIFMLIVSSGVQAQSSVSKPKRIYITLDVSSSMEGNKYVMANYTAQIISVIADKNDKVILYYFGEPHDLGGKNDYKSIQIAFDKLDENEQKSYNEISDLTRFLSDYHDNPNYEDWLFVIGDGDWSIQKGSYNSKREFEATWKKLKGFLQQNNIQVCYLQTGERIDDVFVFTDSLSRVGKPTIDIRKSDTTAASVLENCGYFANRILGFSNESIKMKQEGEQCVSFVSELPLERFVLLYQSRKAGETMVEAVEYNGVVVPSTDVVMRGNPSTAPLVGGKAKSLGGMVWEVKCAKAIPGNAKTKVCFNHPVDASSLVLYPYVDVLARLQPFGWAMDTLNEATSNTFDACDTLTRLNVVITLTDRQGEKFPPPVMQKMTVNLVVGTDLVAVDYEPSDTTFRAVVPMTDDKMSYYVIVESPGYFSRSTVDDPQTVQKTQICHPDPEMVPLVTLPLHVFEPVRFKDIRKKSTFGGMVDDSLFSIIAALGTFDEQNVADQDGYAYLRDLSLSYDEGQLSFTHVPNSSWCECAFADTLHYSVTLRSKTGILHDEKVYEGFVVPVAVPVDKRAWVVRCKSYLIIGGALALFIIYLMALLRKRRFKKNARIVPTYMELRGGTYRENHTDKGRKLRKKDFVSWFKRWFDPFNDESRSMVWDVPPAGHLTFVADKSKERVNITRKSFNKDTMRMADFDPEDDSKLIEMDDIQVYSGRKKYEGKLSFDPGGDDDEKVYRIFVIILIAASVLAEIAVIAVLIKSLL